MGAAPPPPTVPREPGEPSNRWPWVALALGVLVIVAAAAYFFINQQRAVNVNIAGTPTVSALAAAGTASPGPSPTPVTPTVPPSPSVPPSPTAAPSPTQPLASPTPLPAPSPPPPPTVAAPSQPSQPSQPTEAAPPSQPAPPAAMATAPLGTEPTSPPAPPAGAAPAAATPPAATAPAAAPSSTPFAGQVAPAGGFGNTRADLDAAIGPPAGETPEHLVVYRTGNVEYHVAFVPNPNGRAALLVGLPHPTAGPTPQPFTLDQAVAEAHRLLPKDAQPPNPQQEGNPQFVVERATSQTLAQALPADRFTATTGQPGQFLVVYVRDPAQSARITRFIIGPGTDPNALVTQGR